MISSDDEFQDNNEEMTSDDDEDNIKFDKAVKMPESTSTKSRQTVSQHSDICMIDKSKFDIIYSFFSSNIKFDADQLTIKKNIIKFKTLNVEFDDINSNHLKSMLLFCFESEIFKDINADSNHSEIMKTSKNF